MGRIEFGCRPPIILPPVCGCLPRVQMPGRGAGSSCLERGCPTSTRVQYARLLWMRLVTCDLGFPARVQRLCACGYPTRLSDAALRVDACGRDVLSRLPCARMPDQSAATLLCLRIPAIATRTDAQPECDLLPLCAWMPVTDSVHIRRRLKQRRRGVYERRRCPSFRLNFYISRQRVARSHLSHTYYYVHVGRTRRTHMFLAGLLRETSFIYSLLLHHTICIVHITNRHGSNR